MEVSQEAGPSSQAGASNALADLYPPPPQAYTYFTKQNVTHLQVLEGALSETEGGRSKALGVSSVDEWERLSAEERIGRQSSLLREHGVDEEQLPDLDLLLEMGGPRADWIVEDGGYSSFGQVWPIPDVFPSLAAQGQKQLYPEGPIDRRAILQALLRTLLHTHLRLIDVLSHPPREYIATIPDPSAPPHIPPDQRTPVQVWRSEAEDLTDHIRTTVINMQHLLNELRPAQARETLKLVMQSQLDRRRRETELMRGKCAQISKAIERIRADLQDNLAKKEQKPSSGAGTMQNGNGVEARDGFGIMAGM